MNFSYLKVIMLKVKCIHASDKQKNNPNLGYVTKLKTMPNFMNFTHFTF